MNATAEKLVAMDSDRKGRFGEAICEHVMRSSGVTYIPLCKLQVGGAPMAIGGDKKTVLPDFDVAGRGVAAYLDAKVKTKSVRFRKTGQVRHGIDDDKWRQYRSMGILQNKQCGLFVVELLDESNNWSGSLLSESFAGLGEPDKGFSNQKHMVYWPRIRFSSIGSFSADELLRVARGELAINMAALLTTAFSAPPPRCPDPAHLDQSLWIEEPSRRVGFTRTTCRKCGVFIGERPSTRSAAG